MSGELPRTKKPAKGFRQLAKSELFHVRECLTKELTADDQHETIHRARTHLKKLRALLRLVRDYADPKLQRRQNRQLRAVAQSLSPARDCAARLAALQKLYHHHPDLLSADEYSMLEQTMTAQYARQCGLLAEAGNRLKDELQATLQSIATLPLKGLGQSDLRSGLKKTTRRLRKRYQHARHSPTNENLHEWRKSTKDLTYQLHILRHVTPKFTYKRITRLKKLGEVLGDDHDLATVEITLSKTHPRMFKKLETPISKRRRKLQKAAFKLGRKL